MLGMKVDSIHEKPQENKASPVKLLSWLGQHELSVLVAVALIIAGLWLSVELADGVIDGDTQQADEMLLMWLREKGEPEEPIGPRWVEEMMRDLTSLGGSGILVLIVTAVTLFYLIQGRYREMLLMITVVVGAALISSFLKGVFDRPRPELFAGGRYLNAASFPSGHSMLAATTYLTLGIIVSQLMSRNRLKAFILILALFIAALVGFTRVYLGVHWPSDVLAGWAIGVVWAMFTWLVFRWLRQRGAVEEEPVESD